MSSADGVAFESWIKSRFAEAGGFTALILLLSIRLDKVEPISCSYVHVIGDHVRWRDMHAMLDQSRRKWDGVAVFAESPPGGGPLLEIAAKARLQERIDEVTVNRMVLNKAGFFNSRGRPIRIDPVQGDA